MGVPGVPGVFEAGGELRLNHVLTNEKRALTVLANRRQALPDGRRLGEAGIVVVGQSAARGAEVGWLHPGPGGGPQPYQRVELEVVIRGVGEDDVGECGLVGEQGGGREGGRLGVASLVTESVHLKSNVILNLVFNYVKPQE